MSNRVGTFVFTAFFLGLALIQAPSVSADEAANAKVKERKDVMRVIGANMGVLGCYLKNQCNLEPKVLARQGQSIAFMATRSLATFKDPAKGATEKTTSNEKVWSQWADFEKGMQTMVERAAAMEQATASGEKSQVGAAMGALGKTCKGCHDHFRDKKK